MDNLFNSHLFKQVIIGTKSQSRRSLFQKLNLRFQYQNANIDEKKVRNLRNNKFDAIKIATVKAKYLSVKNKNKIIVTFDTTILFKRKTIYKCDTPKSCSVLLNEFNDRSHDLYTGMIFMLNNKILKKHLTKTKVIFKNNNRLDITMYVRKNFNQIKHAVGSYNIEGDGKSFFENIDNSYFNVLGVDIINFIKILKKIS